MRLTRKRTWSQHQLALKLRLRSRADAGIFTWERRRLLIHAAKTALAAAVCWLLALRLGLHDGYWASISAIIVLQSNVGATVNASRDRLLGTLMGAALGFAFSLFGPLWLSYVLALLVAMVACGLLGLRNSSRLAGVTISIVMLVHHGGPHWVLAASRVGEVVLGIVTALAVGTLVFPDRARLRLREGLAEEFLLLGAFFEAILQGFRGAPPPNQPKLREDVQALLSANSQLLEASRNEPSGGPGWREGLAMLSQFGTSLLDVLLALELSVKDSHDDGFAQKLEPELGKLASDIRNSFNHVAGCIHHWKFEAAPKAYSLEEDIAALEARMDDVRHTGIAFAQADILRAYAVQLHLKQIARLLRASRVETRQAAQTVGE
jgi:uncharacterized membrane protein YccC